MPEMESRMDHEIHGALAPSPRTRALEAFHSELRERLSAIEARSRAALAVSERAMADLHETIRHATRAFKDAGEPPERVLSLVKAALQAELTTVHVDERSAVAYMEDAVRWCIDAYYTAA